MIIQPSKLAGTMGAAILVGLCLAASAPQASEAAPLRHIKPRHVHSGAKSLAPAASAAGADVEARGAQGGVAPRTPQTPTTNFLAATLSDTGAFPPDTMGAAGPTQFIIFINGRVRSFAKATGTADLALDMDSDAFFNTVMTPVGGSVVSNFTSDPHVRYDRLSQRWFVVMIDVPLDGVGNTLANRVMVAASTVSTITSVLDFSFFFFQQDLALPAGDTGNFADYPTLGVDANALYIGCNMFTPANSFAGTSAFVVQKSSVLGAGPIQVTAFRDLIPGGAGPGIYTPQGVDNPDPAATKGYFIGVDNAAFGKLVLKRITNPGGAPTISADIGITVPATSFPRDVPSKNRTNTALDSLDDRLYGAMVRNGRLWTAHNIAVNTSGVADTSSASTRRTGSRWYELQNLDANPPTLVQSGTLFDSTASNPLFYWIPTIAVSGQGHAALGCSVSGNNAFVDAVTVGRLASDTLGTLETVEYLTNSATAYNTGFNRWGDYSYTCVDPDDDMTMWTVQEYCQAADSYGVHVARLAAPPPAALTSATPAVLHRNDSNRDVVITGTSSGGSGYFDPGAGFANRLAASVSGAGVTVNSVTFDSPTQVTLNVSVSGVATEDLRNVTVTNPDGQSATGTALLNISSQSDVTLSVDQANVAENGGTATLTATLSGVQATDVTVNLALSGTAAFPADYTRSGLSITVLAGQLTGSATLTAQDDALNETNETIVVDIASVTGPGIENGTQQVTVTLLDDDPVPTVTLGLSGSPCAEAGGAASVTATLSAVSGRDVTVNLGFTGTAALPADYTASVASIVILAGQPNAVCALSAVQDALDENDETIVVDILSVTNATESGTQQVTAQILDDDPTPTVSLSLSGSPFSEHGGQAQVTGTLSAPSGLAVTVNLSFAGTATSGTDYSVSSASIVIPAGSSSAFVTLTGLNDAAVENDETAIVGLATATNATPGAVTQVTAILTDNRPPVAQSGPTAAPNPSLAGQIVRFQVVASDADGDPIAASWTFGDGSAGAGLVPQHVYSAAGTYQAAVTLSDGHAETVLTLEVVVQPLGDAVPDTDSDGIPDATDGDDDGDSIPDAQEISAGTNPLDPNSHPGADVDGDGLNDENDPDDDNDGFTDSFELAAGTSSSSALDTPLGGAPLGTPDPLPVKKLAIGLNFAKPGTKDKIALTGSVTVPADFAPDGQRVIVGVGGVARAFTLDLKGKSPPGTARIVLKLSLRFVPGAPRVVPFTLKMSKGAFADGLEAFGLANTTTNPTVEVSVPVLVVCAGKAFATNRAMIYKAKQDRTGAAKDKKF